MTTKKVKGGKGDSKKGVVYLLCPACRTTVTDPLEVQEKKGHKCLLCGVSWQAIG